MAQEPADLLRRDLENHAKTLSDLTSREARRQDQEEARKQVEQLKEDHLEERLNRIENSIKAIYSLYKWVGVSAGSALLLAVVTFILKGGLFA